MTQAIVEPSSAHRAALTLHALSGSDREWMLQSLTPEQRGVLQPLLAELQELGIPSDAQLFEALGNAGQGAPSAPPEDDPLDRLDESALRQLAPMLAQEPARLTAALLATQSPAWRERLLGALPTDRAAQVRALVLPADASALQAAVRAQIATLLQATPRSGRPASRWGKVRQRLFPNWRAL